MQYIWQKLPSFQKIILEEKQTAAIIFCETRNLVDIPFQKIIVEEKDTAIIFVKLSEK